MENQGNIYSKDEIHLRELVRTMEKRLGIILEKGKTDYCCPISFSQCHIITEIGKSGEMTLNELCLSLNAGKSIMSRTTQKMIDKGILRKCVNEKDRRSVILTLTDEGYKQYEVIQNRMNQYFKDVLDNIPVDKRESVFESLQILNEAITEHI